MHLNYLDAEDFKKVIAFRDYLREHSREAKEYTEVKKRAIKEGKQETLSYLAAKSSMIQEILKKVFEK